MKLLAYQVPHASEDCGSVSSPSQETVSVSRFVSRVGSASGLLKKIGVLRQAQHERKMLNHFKLCTVRPETLEG